MSVPVVSVEQMREWEQASWAAGRSEQEVIETVGRCVARRALALTRPGGRVLILAGRGHNGDDARSARPHLARREVAVVEVTDPEAALPEVEAELARKPALVIDGLFGIGLNRPLAAEWVRLIEAVNDARRPVLAVDAPSGLHCEEGRPMGAALRATITLTLAAPKNGLIQAAARPFVGRLEVEPEIGLVPCPLKGGELRWMLGRDYADYPGPRAMDTHKGTFGHAVMVAGSTGYHGAAVLAARAAQRARPGLITLITSERCYPPVAGQLQAVMVRPAGREPAYPERMTALLFGPGLAGPEAGTLFKGACATAWRGVRQPMVVDASALEWIKAGSARGAVLRVITPHPGEAARMLRISVEQVQADRPAALRELSRRNGGCWVVLKGHQTLIGREEGPVFINSSGNPGLAQGGTGDVLAGFITGWLAQPELQADPGRALRAAVWHHGAAADRLADRLDRWIPEELVAELGRPA